MNFKTIPIGELVYGRFARSQQSSPHLQLSIDRLGLLVPPIVIQHPEGYEIIDGHRRWIALKSLGIRWVPVQIVDGSMLAITALRWSAQKELVGIAPRDIKDALEQCAAFTFREAAIIAEILPTLGIHGTDDQWKAATRLQYIAPMMATYLDVSGASRRIWEQLAVLPATAQEQLAMTAQTIGLDPKLTLLFGAYLHDRLEDGEPNIGATIDAILCGALSDGRVDRKLLSKQLREFTLGFKVDGLQDHESILHVPIAAE